ncbi:6,7-dimethyl-8-ribityllumazine synthase [Dehalococcoidia bacterium]|nr:6,7-dimethyl-8-ribityllumazine synthase [Dehalococcoidia bacterium]
MTRGQKQSGAHSGSNYSGEGKRFAIVVARFNQGITSKLLWGAQEALSENRVLDDDVTVVWVPGAFEIPLVAKRLAKTRLYSGVICLGAVIRGETAHFEYVAHCSTTGVSQAALDTEVPMALGILTTENVDQAEARVLSDSSNKGFEAALAVLETANTLVQMQD